MNRRVGQAAVADDVRNQFDESVRVLATRHGGAIAGILAAGGRALPRLLRRACRPEMADSLLQFLLDVRAIAYANVVNSCKYAFTINTL
jgi:hypothetical protein